MSSPNVCLLGRAEHPEMHLVRDWVQRRVPAEHVSRAASLRQLLDAEPPRPPDLLLVCQTWPDEFRRDELAHAFARWPLARWLCCFANVCEADGRTRQIWPVALRVPARAARWRLDRELQVLAGLAPPLPLTATRDETFAWQSTAPAPHRGPPGSTVRQTVRPLLIDSPDQTVQDWLTDLLVREGYACEGDQPAAIVFDADPWGPAVRERLRLLRHRHPHCPVVAVATFTRPHDVERMRAAGIADLVPRLAVPEGLVETLRRRLDAALTTAG